MVPVRRNQNWLPSIFNDFFDNEWLEKRNTTSPAVNIIENEDEFRIEVAAPGMTKEDFHVEVNRDNELVISMEKKNEQKEEDPKKRDRIDTFLNYYLPTTQKLLDSYAEFEAAGVEGENLRQAKARIESTMDLIIKGFEHQLDELYKADAMDVDSDIRVMETMLERDTASVEKDFGLGEFAAEQKPEETE